MTKKVWLNKPLSTVYKKRKIESSTKGIEKPSQNNLKGSGLKMYICKRTQRAINE